MTVKEALDVLTQCDPDRTLYVRASDGTAQPLAAIVDLEHVHIPPELGISIPPDVALLAAMDMP